MYPFMEGIAEKTFSFIIVHFRKKLEVSWIDLMCSIIIYDY